MGRFSHEAVDIDPRTGIAYLTEDDFEGLIDDDDPNLDTRRSYLYRFLPNDRRARPGALQQGGTLQVAKLDEAPARRRLHRSGPAVHDALDQREPRDPARQTPWPRTPPASTASRARSSRAGRSGSTTPPAARTASARSSATSRRRTPSSSTTRARTRTAWRARTTSPSPPGATCGWPRTATSATGSSASRPEGRSYVFANNRVPFQSSPGVPAGDPGERSEFAGPTFSPDGQTFFVNIQSPGITYAIWGPFKPRKRRPAAPDGPRRAPEEARPQVSGELSEAAAEVRHERARSRRLRPPRRPARLDVHARPENMPPNGGTRPVSPSLLRNASTAFPGGATTRD